MQPKQLLLLGALAASLNSEAQQIERVPYELICSSFERIAKEITDKHQEFPLWMGNKPPSDIRFILFVNPVTTTWTMTATDTKHTCILAHGEGFAVSQGSNKNKL